MKFVLRILITAVVAFGLSSVLPGIHKPILIILTLPITILTFGLFLFVINALIVLLTGNFVRGFEVDGFGWALLFSLLLSLLTSLLYRDPDRDTN